MGSQKPHIALFPSWGMGHLIPFVEFAKRMAINHCFTVTFITTPSILSPAKTAPIQDLASSGLDIRLLEFPPPDDKAHPAKDFVIHMVELVEKCRDPLKDVLRILKDDVCAFVTDLFCTAMVEVSASLDIPTYVLWTTSASNLCFMLSHPTLHTPTTDSLCNMDGLIDIPCLPSVPTLYFPERMQSRNDPMYHVFVRLAHPLFSVEGILINSFNDLESATIRAMFHGKRELLVLPNGNVVDKGPEIYPIGPLTRSADEALEHYNSGCLESLDRQPVASVIFVAFGSIGFLSAEQTRELALGLEASGQRFLWVLRTPPGLPASEFIPPGFETRTRDRGLVWLSWAPQMHVLSHPSTAGFVSHCGWNSVLESISCGIPILAWPIQAEQKSSAFLLVNGIGVAIEPAWGPNWWVGKEEVARVARELMEGERGRKMRAKAVELKESATKAVALGGSSTHFLSTVAARWKKGNETLLLFDPISLFKCLAGNIIIMLALEAAIQFVFSRRWRRLTC